MTEHGWERDDWPAIFEQVMAADILVLCTPIWLGEKSSVCTQVIERLYGNSHLLNDAGQYAYYGRVGGCLVTGNEDGVKHCAMNILYSLQHLGYAIPPQADAGWIGEAGPGPSYLDPGSGGPENDFTNRNTTFMTWNLLHLARMLKDARRHPRPRQPALGVGRRLPLRLPQPRAPLTRGPAREPGAGPRVWRAYGSVVDRVNVSVLLYVPVRSASFASMCWRKASETGVVGDRAGVAEQRRRARAGADVGQRDAGAGGAGGAGLQHRRERERPVDEATGRVGARVGDRQGRAAGGRDHVGGGRRVVVARDARDERRERRRRAERQCQRRGHRAAGRAVGVRRGEELEEGAMLHARLRREHELAARVAPPVVVCHGYV